MGGIANAVSESLMQLPICIALHQFSMHYQKNTSYLEIAALPLPLVLCYFLVKRFCIVDSATSQE
jgi:hypothetical protein